MKRGEGVDEVAAVVHRLSVLLAAGVAPASALAHLAASDDSEAAGAVRRRRLLRAVAVEAARGGDVTAALLAGVPASRRGEGRRERERVPRRRGGAARPSRAAGRSPGR